MKKEWLTKTLTLGIVVLFIGTGAVSAFNVNLTDESMTMMDNHPPYAPDVEGARFVSPGTHEWTFKAIDPDDDNISYQIDWGDGCFDDWFGPFKSGEEITKNHTYLKYGRALVCARAKDIYNATGEWGFMKVVIPKSKQIINIPFLHFLEQFQNAFSIFRYVFRGR
jgi:hypothetical protein